MRKTNANAEREGARHRQRGRQQATTHDETQAVREAAGNHTPRAMARDSGAQATTARQGGDIHTQKGGATERGRMQPQTQAKHRRQRRHIRSSQQGQAQQPAISDTRLQDENSSAAAARRAAIRAIRTTGGGGRERALGYLTPKQPIIQTRDSAPSACAEGRAGGQAQDRRLSRAAHTQRWARESDARARDGSARRRHIGGRSYLSTRIYSRRGGARTSHNASPRIGLLDGTLVSRRTRGLSRSKRIAAAITPCQGISRSRCDKRLGLVLSALGTRASDATVLPAQPGPAHGGRVPWGRPIRRCDKRAVSRLSRWANAHQVRRLMRL